MKQPTPDTLPIWMESATRGWLVKLRLQPGARRTRVIGEHGGELKVAIQSPPVDGKANTALIKWFADGLRVPRSAVTLVSGQTSRSKKIALDKDAQGLDLVKILAFLQADN